MGDEGARVDEGGEGVLGWMRGVGAVGRHAFLYIPVCGHV